MSATTAAGAAVERMNGVDAMMLYLDATSAYNHTVKLFVLDPSRDPEGWSWERFRQAFASRLHLVPRLTQCYLTVPLGLNHPVWAPDPDFRLDEHLFRVQCPAPGDMRALCALVSERYARALPHDRPLWQLHLIEGLEGGRVAALMLVHHALTDGIGILRMLTAFWGTRSDLLVHPGTPPERRDPLPSRERLLLDGARTLPGLLFGEVPGAVRGLRGMARLRREWRREGREPPPMPRDPRYPAPFAVKISSERSFAATSFPLARFKAIARRHAATINDVYLACVSGAIRRLLADRGGAAPSAPMIATVPFALVPLEERTRDGNYSTVNYTLLHVDVDDPVRRLAACRASADAMKAFFARTRDANTAGLLNILPPFIPKLLGRLNESRGGGLLPFWNVVVSNVPGPRAPLHLGALQLSDWYSTGQVTHGAALNVTAWSYGDRFNVCTLAARDVLPDPWALMTHFEAALAELDPEPGSASAPAAVEARADEARRLSPID